MACSRSIRGGSSSLEKIQMLVVRDDEALASSLTGWALARKTRVIRKPGGVKNLPVDIILPHIPRQCNSLDRASFNILAVHSLLIDVCEVFAIGRDRPSADWILRGIDGELPKFNIGWSLKGRCLALRKP